MAEVPAKRQKVVERFQQTALMVAEKRFRKACTQINVLNRHLEAIQFRYNKAKSENCNSFRYNLRLKLAVIEGSRNMYYDYAHIQAEIVAELRQHLYGEIVDLAAETDDDDDE